MRTQGEVKFDGKSLEDASISFIPVENTPGGSFGGPIKQGRYDLPAAEGPLAGGKYKVEISALRKIDKPQENIIEPGGPPLYSYDNYIPAKYNVRSTLSATISDDPSKNEFNFDLQGNK